MNKAQRAVLFLTAFSLIGMLLFPPFTSQYLQGVTVNAGYSFILSPPTYVVAYNTYNSKVNSTLLARQFVIVDIAGGAFFFALKSK